MSQQFFLQHAARLDEQASIDSLMGHAAGLVVGMFAPQPARDLLRRPLELKLNRYCPAQRRATSELARLGATCAIPSRPIRSRSPIACAASIVPHLAADRRWRTSQLTGNRSKRQLRPQPSGDLLALGQPQRQARPLPRLALRLSEREEISRGLRAQLSLRTIARQLRRAPSTISREVRHNGGRTGYRAARSDRAAWDRTRRPKPCKFACRPALCRTVSV